MTDTEARRLAEIKQRHEMYAANIPANITHAFNMAHMDRASLIAITDRLTRLETPGLTEADTLDLKAARLMAAGARCDHEDTLADVIDRCCAIISRLTQPTSTAGEETLRTDTASNADSHVNSVHGGTVAGLTSLPSVGPGAWQDIASAPKDGTTFLAKCFESPRFARAHECKWDEVRYAAYAAAAKKLGRTLDNHSSFYDGWPGSMRPPTHWMPLPSAPVTTAPAVDGGWLPAEEMICIVCSAKITTGDMCAKCGDGK